MSHIICLCGEIIPSGIYPCPDGFDITSDFLDDIIYDQLMQAYRESKHEGEFGKRIAAVFSHLKTPGLMRAYQCPHCQRLVVFARANDWQPIFWFQLEKNIFSTKLNSLREAVEKMKERELPSGWQRDLEAKNDPP